MNWERFWRGPMMELMLDDGVGDGGRPAPAARQASQHDDGDDRDEDGDEDDQGDDDLPTDPKELRKQLAAARKTNERLERESQFNFNEAERLRRGRQQPEPDDDPDSDDEPEGDDPAEEAVVGDLLEDLAKEGLKALKKRGFVTAKEATELARKAATDIISQAQTRMTQDARIVGANPDLNNPESELFKRTQIELKNLEQIDPAIRRNPAAWLHSAVTTAKAGLAAEGKQRRRQTDDEDDDEQDRRRRVRAQSGDRSTGRSGFDAEDLDPVVGQEVNSVLDMMRIKNPKARARVLDKVAANRRGR